MSQTHAYSSEIDAEQKERNCLEVLNSESRTKIDTISRKQALIQKNEVCFVS